MVEICALIALTSLPLGTSAIWSPPGSGPTSPRRRFVPDNFRPYAPAQGPDRNS